MKVFMMILMMMLWVEIFAQKPCRLVRVVDGDTFELLCDSRKMMTRLKNVDAPELDQFYGQLITDSLKLLMEGEMVTLYEDKKDLYGRHLVKIEWEDMSLDSFLIAKGWAWHYHAYSDDPGLAEIQDSAREGQCGMWLCGYNVPPWIWRSLNKRNKRLYRLCR